MINSASNSVLTSRFWWRAGPSLLLLAGLGVYLSARFHLGIDAQVHKCLPPSSVWLIDRHDRRLIRDTTVAFVAGRTMAPFFAPGQIVIKRLAGVPGDRVAVTPQRTTVNGIPVGAGLALASTLHRPPAAFVREEALGPDALWMMGGTDDSFDSRYWGSLPGTQLLGRAYAID